MNGYIIGGDNKEGYLLKTTDAGQTWAATKLEVPRMPTGLHFLNKDVGFITGIGCFKKTTDGGQTWTSIRPESESAAQYRRFNYVNFKNGLEGIVTSSNGVYYKTTDGGNTWDSLRFPGGGNLLSIYYAGEKILVQKWWDTVVDLNNSIVSMKFPQGVLRLLFLDDQHSIAVGHRSDPGDYVYPGKVFVTNNGWRTHASSAKSHLLNGPIGCIARVSSNKAMTIGWDHGYPAQVIVLKW
jgi:hypothetical protein